MLNLHARQKGMIRYWQRGRGAYDAVLAAASILPYFYVSVLSAAIGDSKGHSDLEVFFLYLRCACGANFPYSIAYAVEFFFLGTAEDCWWNRTGRTLLFAAGTTVGAFLGGGAIRVAEYAYRPT